MNVKFQKHFPCGFINYFNGNPFDIHLSSPRPDAQCRDMIITSTKLYTMRLTTSAYWDHKFLIM